MTYSEAQSISETLLKGDTQPARLLKRACATLDKTPTFIIMRYGDPRKWDELPKKVDKRLDYTYRKSVIRKATRSKSTKTTNLVKEWKRPVSVRPCALEHLNGRIIRASSIAEFCRKANLRNPSDKFHVTPVLDGDRPSFKGWHLIGVLSRKLEVKDVYGNLTKVTVRELIGRYKVKMGSVMSLLDGRKKSILNNRVMLASTEIHSPLTPKNYQTTQVKLTDGKRVYSGKTICEAARNAGMTAVASIYPVAYGFRDSFRGLTVKSVEVEKKRVLG